MTTGSFQIWNLAHAWKPSDYAALIDLAGSACTSFLLVARGESSAGPQSVLDVLKPFLIDARRGRAWPGTRLLAAEVAEILKFRLTKESGQLLLASCESLWDWIGPRNPEDLSFLRASGHPWFVSTAHERDAFFKIRDREKEVIEARFGKGSLLFECTDQCPDEVY